MELWGDEHVYIYIYMIRDIIKSDRIETILKQNGAIRSLHLPLSSWVRSFRFLFHKLTSELFLLSKYLALAVTDLLLS